MGIPLAISHAGINLDQDYLRGVSSLLIRIVLIWNNDRSDINRLAYILTEPEHDQCETDSNYP
jgi:hypothetical protein